MTTAPPPYSAGKGPEPYPAQPAGYGPPPGQPGYPAQPGQPGYGQPGYPAGQPGYPAPGGYQQPPQMGPTVVVAQPAVTVVQTFRESPVHTKCPHCQAEIVTATMYETGTFAWIICLVLCLVGCDLGCCLIPFCVDGCKDVAHTCPNCRQQIARWSRM